MSFFITGSINDGVQYVVRHSSTRIIIATYDASPTKDGRVLGAERAARHAALVNDTPVDVPLRSASYR